MNNQYLLDHLRVIPDFPQKGIQFRDVTTLFKDAKCLDIMEEEMYELYKDKGITKVVGIESRGFILAPAVAMELGAGFVPIRKPNKLPAETVSVTYQKEYGEDSIQMHKDALKPEDVVLIHDDILATGGSILAAVELVRKLGVKTIYANCLIELEGLNGKRFLADRGIDCDCMMGIEVDE